MRLAGSGNRRAERTTAGCFVAAAVAAVIFSVIYWSSDSILGEGISLGVSLLLIALGLIAWSHHLMPQGPYEEEYPSLRSPAAEEAAVLARLDRGGVGRRRLLLGTLGLVTTSVGVGAVSSVRSLGPEPYSFAHTPWRGGRFLVTSEGAAVHTAGMPVNSVLTVFPEGFTSDPMAVATLIRLPPGRNHPLAHRATWAPHGFICYSRVCPHAGCPVSLYNHPRHQLECPCHQSTFDVLEGGRPVFGPAGGRLPQLPLKIEADGRLRSTGDFSAPPGPVYWHHS